MSDPVWQPPTFDRVEPIVPADSIAPVEPNDYGAGFSAAAEPPPIPVRHIPHFGHAFTFGAIAFVMLVAVSAAILFLNGNWQTLSTVISPRLQLAAEAAAYLLTLAVAWFLFPAMWSSPGHPRSFLEGISWNLGMARRYWLRLVVLGLVVGVTSQALSSLIPVPKTIPMDEFFRTRTDVLLTAAFGTLFAPIFEEICFRGFLLPAFAIAFDWFSLKRTPEAKLYWQTTNTHSRSALIFSSILTSLIFGLLHATQLGDSWAAVALLVCVSLALCYVRIRTASTACSTLVHMCYNLSVFILLFIATDGLQHLEKITN